MFYYYVIFLYNKYYLQHMYALGAPREEMIYVWGKWYLKDNKWLKTQIQELTEVLMDIFSFFFFLSRLWYINYIKWDFFLRKGKDTFRKQKHAVLHLTSLILETSKNILRRWIVCSLAGLLLTATYVNRPQTQITLKICEFLSY